MVLAGRDLPPLEAIYRLMEAEDVNSETVPDRTQARLMHGVRAEPDFEVRCKVVMFNAVDQVGF